MVTAVAINIRLSNSLKLLRWIWLEATHVRELHSQASIIIAVIKSALINKHVIKNVPDETGFSQLYEKLADRSIRAGKNTHVMTEGFSDSFLVNLLY